MSGMRLVVGVIVVLFAATVFGQQSVCFRPPETSNCRAFIPSFYYNSQIGQCDCFVYGGCNPGGNQFDNLQSCMQTCSVPQASQRVTSECSRLFGSDAGNSAGATGARGGENLGVAQNIIRPDPVRQGPSSPRRPDGCFESPETGMCRAFIPSYYFNPQTRSCDCFAFGGCRPNPNNFASVGECMQTCLVEPSAQFLSNECIRLFGNQQPQQPSTSGQQPGQGQIGSQVDQEFIRQNQGSQNLGNQNLGNQNLGNQNLGNQNFRPIVTATPPPFIAPIPTTFAPRQTTVRNREPSPGSVSRLTPVSSVFYSPSGTETGPIIIGQPVRIPG